MTRIALITLLALAQLPAVEYQFDHQDKVYHATAGAVIGGIGWWMVDKQYPRMAPWKKWLCAMTPVLIAGVGKELYDRNHGGEEDWMDAAATVGGGAITVTLIEWKF